MYKIYYGMLYDYLPFMIPDFIILYLQFFIFFKSHCHLEIEHPQQQLLLFTVKSTELCLWLNFSVSWMANKSPFPKMLLTKAKQEVCCQLRVITLFMLTTAAFTTDLINVMLSISVHICMLLTSKKCACFFTITTIQFFAWPIF